MHNELDALFAAIDQAFESVRQQHPEAIACGKGCSDCCNAVFDVSLVEAANLWAHFQRLAPALREKIVLAAQEAQRNWEHVRDSGLDLSVARIRCPLLDEAGLCLCYEARPVNCRTYGIPTVIDGKGRVCGLSGFEQGTTYPTVNLATLQRILYDLSSQLAGAEEGAKRWPIASVILSASPFSGFAEGLISPGEK